MSTPANCGRCDDREVRAEGFALLSLLRICSRTRLGPNNLGSWTQTAAHLFLFQGWDHGSHGHPQGCVSRGPPRPFGFHSPSLRITTLYFLSKGRTGSLGPRKLDTILCPSGKTKLRSCELACVHNEVTLSKIQGCPPAQGLGFSSSDVPDRRLACRSQTTTARRAEASSEDVLCGTYLSRTQIINSSNVAQSAASKSIWAKYETRSAVPKRGCPACGLKETSKFFAFRRLDKQSRQGKL